MTEMQWLKSVSAKEMFVFLQESPYWPSERKLRLLACAFINNASGSPFAKIWDESQCKAYDWPPLNWHNCFYLLPEKPEHSQLVRDIIGNPFRSLALCGANDKHLSCTLCDEIRSPTLLAIAEATYEERDSNGQLLLDNIAILSDALEDALHMAGCKNEILLRALRWQSPCPDCLGTGVNDSLYFMGFLNGCTTACSSCQKPNSAWMIPPKELVGWATNTNPMPYRGFWPLDLVLGRE
jgi:hypothetical protein